MKLKTTFTASLLASSALASTLRSFHERQASGSFYPITGPTGGVHPRLEIRQLQKTGEMWNLFLLAMAEFEAMDQNEIDSYYQIAGIHGMPWYDWDGVKMNPGIEKPVKRGYCPHSNLLFGIWHRPYVLLFEQKLQAIAINIANRFSGDSKPKYQEAASKLRLPYWDWAQKVEADEPVFPTAFSTERVEVTQPDNNKVVIDNPLFDFDFHPLDNKQINGTGCGYPLAGGPLDNHFKMCNEAQRTVRKAQTAARNVSNHVALEAAFKNLYKPLRYNLFKVLSRWQPFDSFANNGNCGDPLSFDSLEAVHDSIHVEMAPAHMVPVAVSAFDPVFWMHHANVDRYLAIWQAIYPDTYVEQCNAGSETWTIKLNDSLAANSPLTPFHMNTAGDFWTAAKARDIRQMGYTYPELASNPSNATLVTEVIRLYSEGSNGGARRAKREDVPEASQVYLAQAELPSGGSPYSIYVFLGEVTDNAVTWSGLDSFVGLASTLGTHGTNPLRSTIDLTHAVGEKIAKGDIKEDGALDYLKQHLKWRLVFAEEEIPRDKIPGAKVSLVTTTVEKASSESEFDRWLGDFTAHGAVDS
ncbi:Di-copper centre-containing protein [Westerdykella ornata]|uniref:tyrosinase n=1 Tax=Westerdykella ornata TaxID=318751 RepID=A0A6A6J781_WESOR|nr:Di-copper centre-containing protein [Westerdykella ornata]KAF2272084.1 Di-copper centre-containing protein [Westerdykella ornata]